jgi:hypothetical protein
VVLPVWSIKIEEGRPRTEVPILRKQDVLDVKLARNSGFTPTVHRPCLWSFLIPLEMYCTLLPNVLQNL